MGLGAPHGCDGCTLNIVTTGKQPRQSVNMEPVQSSMVDNLHTRKQKSWNWTLGTRLGEARNPGPWVWLQPPQRMAACNGGRGRPPSYAEVVEWQQPGASLDRWHAWKGKGRGWTRPDASVRGHGLCIPWLGLRRHGLELRGRGGQEHAGSRPGDKPVGSTHGASRVVSPASRHEGGGLLTRKTETVQACAGGELSNGWKSGQAAWVSDGNGWLERRKPKVRCAMKLEKVQTERMQVADANVNYWAVLRWTEMQRKAQGGGRCKSSTEPAVTSSDGMAGHPLLNHHHVVLVSSICRVLWRQAC